ncbi:hypothetical protein [uncultured Tenacibaculum sp.]|jgi:hypothetical protein|uniref:hypothetical protein n=1 Tax=uncultured Tenacibaculum sp. TaxID=174713 RepID=UPI0026151C85|nr:hypothetical protein [uncultured Tenacibaculum sp.]
MKSKYFLPILLVAFALFSCSSDDISEQDQLPPISQTGENTMGCLVNGEVFIPKDKTGFSGVGGDKPKGITVIKGSNLPQYEYFSIALNNYEGIYIYLYIAKESPLEETYVFSDSPGVAASLDKPDYNHSFGLIYDSKLTSYQNSGSITFTKADSENGLYAGIFNLKLKNTENEKDIIEITEGRFDLDLKTLNQN